VATLLLISRSTTAVAAPSRASWLQWDAPPECPKSDDIRKQIEAWLEGPIPTDTGLAVQTKLSWSGSRWEVRVRVAFDGHAGQRSVAVADCSDAADFVAVAVVLALDPSLAVKLPGTEEPAVGEASASVPDSDHDSFPRESDLGAEQGRRLSPAALPSARDRPPLPAPARATAFFGGAAGEVLIGVLPETQLGFSLGAGGRIGAWSVGLDGHWLPASGATPENAAAPIDFQLVMARAGGAYSWTLGRRLRLGPLLSVEGGAILSRQRGPTPSRRTAPWLAVASGAGALFALSSRLHLLGEVDLVAPLTRPRFVLNDGSAVHEVGLSARFSLGARLFFPAL
jgi:hypothetical protein